MSAIAPKPPLPVLPSLPATVLPAIASLTDALNIPRDVLASDEEIEYAWNDLPRELRDIPSHLRGELIAKMCVAVSAGLFDSAMNYIWNAAVLHLRQKIRNFGLPVVATILETDFEEKHLMDRQDSQLLELALKLNLVAEDGFFFLDQCRSVRNSFSAAHPTMGAVNDREFTTFLNRCVRYALADSSSPKGVDLKAFLSAVKGGRFTDNQKIIWNQRLLDTHDAQRQMLTLMVYGIYCDPNASEFSRQNSIDICISLKESFTSSTRSELVSKHSEYAAKGDDPRHAASLQFFERLGALQLLDNAEQHAIFNRALERLWTAHSGSNNFYSEPPFAERILELSRQGAVPDTVQETFVNNIVCCMLGNGYGVCWAAAVYYEQIIRAFSPREIALMISLAHTKGNPISTRLHLHPSCQTQFKKILTFIDPASVDTNVRPAYDAFVAWAK